MMDIQPSFYQWRKKVNGALALEPKRVALSFTAPNGRIYSIEPEELQTPQAGTYTARFGDADKAPELVISSDYEVLPELPTTRKAPEDAIISRYERMAEDLELARRGAETRAQAAEAEKLAALDLVKEQQKRVFELEKRIAELEVQGEPLFDDDTAALVLEVIDRWSGAGELREQVTLLLTTIEEDPRAAERLAKRAPRVISDLVRLVQVEGS